MIADLRTSMGSHSERQGRMTCEKSGMVDSKSFVHEQGEGMQAARIAMKTTFSGRELCWSTDSYLRTITYTILTCHAMTPEESFRHW